MVSSDRGWLPGPTRASKVIINGRMIVSLTMFENYSKEEQLLWERKKCASWGITSYDLEPVSGRIIFPAGGSLFFCADPASGFTGPLFPYEIQVRGSPRLDN